MKLRINDALTYLRILLTPFMLACFYTESFLARKIGVAFFIFLCLTDFFDGYIARTFKTESRIGKMLDPLADKWLMIATFILLIHKQQLSAFEVFLVYIFVFREIGVMGIRILSPNLASAGSSKLGKVKTVILSGAITIFLFNFALEMPFCELYTLAVVLMIIGISFSLISGARYFKAFIAECQAEK